MKEHKETISAYIDDALSKGELSDLLGFDEIEQSYNQAERYHLIGEALRGQIHDASLVNVRQQVRQVIDESAHRSFEQSGDISTKTSSSWISWLTPAWYRPLGGLAVAASIAMVMVVSVSVTNDEATTGVSNVADNKDGLAPVMGMPAVALEQQPPHVQLVSSQPGQDVNLDAYLAEHAEFAAQDTMQGRLPYVRAVSYKSE